VFLLDTNVVSELRRAADGKANEHLVAWASGVEAGALYLSSISILELEIGVQRLERRDKRQGKVLRAWLSNKVMRAFHGRILPFDQASAVICAKYHVPNPRPDRDSIIAAIAENNNMTVVTRNTKDFEPLGVAVLNPWLPRR
jgi:predicted nucleic acid-binding protein